MKKKMSLAIVCALVLLFTACSGGRGYEMEEAAQLYLDSGIEIDLEEKPNFESVGAVDGILFDVEDDDVIIYQYKSEKTLTKALEDNFALRKMASNKNLLIDTKNEDMISILKEFSPVPNYYEELKKERDAKIIRKQIEEPFSIGDFDITILSSKFRSEIVTSDFLSSKATDGKQYFMIEATVENTGKSAETFIPLINFSDETLNAKLLYNEEYEYNPIEILVYDDAITDTLISPLEKAQGYFVFSVPNEVVESGGSLALDFFLGETQVRVELEHPGTMKDELGITDATPLSKIDIQIFSQAYDGTRTGLLKEEKSKDWSLPGPEISDGICRLYIEDESGWSIDVAYDEASGNIYLITLEETILPDGTDYQQGLAAHISACSAALIGNSQDYSADQDRMSVILKNILQLDEPSLTKKAKVLETDSLKEVIKGLKLESQFINDKIVISIVPTEENPTMEDEEIPEQSESEDTPITQKTPEPEPPKTEEKSQDKPAQKESNENEAAEYSNDASEREVIDRFAGADIDIDDYVADGDTDNESLTGIVD